MSAERKPFAGLFSSGNFAEAEHTLQGDFKSTSDAQRLAGNLERIQENLGLSTRLKRRSSAWSVALQGLAWVSLTLLCVWIGNRTLRSPGPLLLEDGSALGRVENPNGDTSYLFEEGSRIHLSRDTSLVAVRNSDREMVFDLDRGRARFAITPDGPRRWTVRTPTGSVEVLGTAFDLAVLPNGFSVRVERGRVLVKPTEGYRANSSQHRGSSVELTAGMSDSWIETQEHAAASQEAPSVSPEPDLAPVPSEDRNAIETRDRLLQNAGGNFGAHVAHDLNDDLNGAEAPETGAVPSEDPNSPRARLTRAENARRARNTPAMIAECEALLRDAEAFEEQRYARLYLAEAYSERGNYRDAVQILPEGLMVSWPLSLYERGFGLLLEAQTHQGARDYCSSWRTYLRRTPEGLHSTPTMPCEP